jgi:hypothetical protein
MIVPVIVTAIILLPFLLYIVFADQSLVPTEIEMHELSAEEKKKPPVDPNIPDGRGILEEQEKQYENAEQVKAISLGEIMHPFIDRKSAAFGAFIMSATLITLLTINASDQPNGQPHSSCFAGILDPDGLNGRRRARPLGRGEKKKRSTESSRSKRG